MQGYLSDVTARWLLMELARTTLLVAVLGVAAWLVLRLARVSSPTMHRVCGVMVLLAGWTLVRWPVDVAWYEAPPTVMAEIAEAEPEPESFTPPIDPNLLSPPPEFGVGVSAPAMAAPEVEAATTEPLPALLPDPTPEVTPQPAWQIAWEQLAIAVWLLGIVSVVAVWLVGYLRFLWQLPRGGECSPEWQTELHAAVEGQGRAGRVEFRVTEDAGPLLCRLPRRTVLLVPRSLWNELDAVERRAILRHELAHLSRGDLWKSLAVRVLALPHWFNPVAWLAVRRFDDAAEWACDRAAMGEQPTTYAAMLLRLGELAGTRARFGSAMSNRPLTTRIRRLLTLTGTEDSAMKKACLMSLLLLVVPLALVRVNLVAEEPEPKAAEAPQQEAVDVPAPAAAGELTPPAKEPEPPRAQEPADNPVKAARRKMVETASKAYEANLVAYQSRTITLDPVFAWSLHWLTAELAVASSREEQLVAARRHLERMQSIEGSIRSLFESGSHGGEANAMYGASYYVADAERRLAEIEAMPEPQAKAQQPAANREMVDAAKQAYEATYAAYSAGTGTLEAVISWSNRWLAGELEIARSREEQLAAAQAHLDRTSMLHTKVEALYRTGSNGGEANVMATANYYLADAKQRLAEIERQPEQTSATSGQRSTAAPNIELREPLAAPGGTQSGTPRGWRSPPLTPYPEPAAGERVEEPNVVHRYGGKYYQLDDPALPTALKAALREGTREEMIQAMADVCIHLPRTDGSTVEFRYPQLAPELIALLGHEDSKIRDRAENALLSIRSSIEDELQEAAKSDDAEIATRAQRLLKKSEPQPPRQPSGYFKLLSQQAESQSPTARQMPSSSAAGSQQTPVYRYQASSPPQARSVEPSPTPKYVFNPYSNQSLEYTPPVATTTVEAAGQQAGTLRRSREFREGMPTLVEKSQLYYDGKTFDQWRTQLQTDLSPTLRKEAINAVGEFAAHGYGKEAADVLFDTMSDYSVWTVESSPEGQLKQAALLAAKRVATADRLPAIIEALKSDNKNETLFALRIIPEDATKADLVPLLEAAVSGADPQVAELAEAPLATLDHDNPVLIDAIHRKLESKQEHQVQQALYMVRGAVSGRIRPYPELLPMALGLLDHADSAIQLVAIDTLGSQAPAHGHTEYVEALKKIASSGDGAASVNARKMLDKLNPQPSERRR